MRTKNEAIYQRVKEYLFEQQYLHNTTPTIREMERALNIPRATLSRYVNDMKELNILSSHGHRSIKIGNQNNMVPVPVLGSVSCGVPKFAEEYFETFVSMPVELVGQGEFYFLRANGDSMIGAGINDGDLVLIRKQSYADNGQIVLAFVESEATLKRFFYDQKKKQIRLHPENKTMFDMFPVECEIQGVAVYVMKALK